jgi:hypothetical protein
VGAVGAPEPSDPARQDPAGTRLTGTEAVKLHLTLAGGLVICVAAFLFEVRRALGGNELSWAYVFEWPLFAVFAFYMWWNLLHQRKGRRRSDAGPKVVAPEHVEMLKAWQEQQRKLAATEAAEGAATRAAEGAATRRARSESDAAP